MKSLTANHSYCGLTRTLWSRYDRAHERTGFSSTRNGEDDLPVFCVAAILILNRHKVIKETRSIDDLIKVANLTCSFFCIVAFARYFSCLCLLRAKSHLLKVVMLNAHF